MVDKYQRCLQEVIKHCIEIEESELTPSDFTSKELDLEDLDSIVEIMNR